MRVIAFVMMLLMALLSTAALAEVDLVYFKAFSGDEQVLLEWKTASETDNLGFYIERSEDTVTYSRITQLIPGAGTSTIEHIYTKMDRDVINGTTYYYNLITVDFEGVEQIANENPVSATPAGDIQPPETINDLSAQLHGGMKSYWGNIYLSWSEPFDSVGVAQYVIYRSTEPYQLGDSLSRQLIRTISIFMLWAIHISIFITPSKLSIGLETNLLLQIKSVNLTDRGV